MVADDEGRRWSEAGAVLAAREPEVFANLLALAEIVIASRSPTGTKEKRGTPSIPP